MYRIHFYKCLLECSRVFINDSIEINYDSAFDSVDNLEQFNLFYRGFNICTFNIENLVDFHVKDFTLYVYIE